jgi:hypothetical protein
MPASKPTEVSASKPVLSATRLPNFFLVGAAKAGTTSFYNYLDQHPAIFMSPIKEPSYFSSEVRPENFAAALRRNLQHELDAARKYLRGPMNRKRFGGPVAGWDDYRLLFRNARAQTAIGEASVTYLWSKTAAREIAARIPNARIIMILRNPVERAFSQYHHAVTGGWIRVSFHEQLQISLESRGESFDVMNPHLAWGLYYEQVRRYLDLFPAENVKIFLYEDYRDRPRKVLADTFRFLGVDPGDTPDLTKRSLEPRIPRSLFAGWLLKRSGVWQPLAMAAPDFLRPALKRAMLRPRDSIVMEPRDKETLREYYREDVGKLANLLGQDLNRWLES